MFIFLAAALAVLLLSLASFGSVATVVVQLGGCSLLLVLLGALGMASCANALPLGFRPVFWLLVLRLLGLWFFWAAGFYSFLGKKGF